MKRKLNSGIIFDSFNILFFIICAVIMVYPFWNVIMTSLVTSGEFYSRSVILWPRELALSSYNVIFANDQMVRSLGVTVFITIVGTIYSMFLTITLAYGLSLEKLPGRKFLVTLVVITMYFSCGLVPYYILVKNLNMIDTIWALIIPAGINVWNFIVIRSFFLQLPPSLSESAKLDGANDFQILFRIMLPISMPVLAAFTLFYSVDYWNSWWNALLFIRSKKLIPLQFLLRELVVKGSNTQFFAYGQGDQLFQAGVKMATVVVATAPILVVYPFLQKYFVKGVALGAVKG